MNTKNKKPEQGCKDSFSGKNVVIRIAKHRFVSDLFEKWPPALERSAVDQDGCKENQD